MAEGSQARTWCRCPKLADATDRGDRVLRGVRDAALPHRGSPNARLEQRDEMHDALVAHRASRVLRNEAKAEERGLAHLAVLRLRASHEVRHEGGEVPRRVVRTAAHVRAVLDDVVDDVDRDLRVVRVASRLRHLVHEGEEGCFQCSKAAVLEDGRDVGDAVRDLVKQHLLLFVPLLLNLVLLLVVLLKTRFRNGDRTPLQRLLHLLRQQLKEAAYRCVGKQATARRAEEPIARFPWIRDALHAELQGLDPNHEKPRRFILFSNRRREDTHHRCQHWLACAEVLA